MRILVVTSMYPTEKLPFYGVFVAEQVRSLQAAGIGAEVLFINPRETRFNYALSAPTVVKRLRSERYDIIHTHHTFTMPLVRLARAWARCSAPIVLTNHEGEALDTTHRSGICHPLGRLRRSIALKRWMAQRADFVIFVSRQLSDVLARTAPYAVIPCGVDLQRFKPMAKEHCRTQLGIPHDAPVLFFPGRPGARGKRFELAQAAHKIIQRSHPGAQLLTGGAIAYEMMPAYYNAADVVIQSSFYEASPTVVKETIACEVPLVSTDSGDTREIVNGVQYCFVCQANPEELASRALMCIGHRAIGGRKRLIEQGLSLEQVTQRLILLYQGLVRK